VTRLPVVVRKILPDLPAHWTLDARGDAVTLTRTDGLILSIAEISRKTVTFTAQHPGRPLPRALFYAMMGRNGNEGANRLYDELQRLAASGLADPLKVRAAAAITHAVRLILYANVPTETLLYIERLDNAYPLRLVDGPVGAPGAVDPS
jgi:hypothetical protein